MMFYMYCIKLGRSEEEFWNSRCSKIFAMIDISADEAKMKASAINNEPYQSKYFDSPRKINSMREIEGFV